MLISGKDRSIVSWDQLLKSGNRIFIGSGAALCVITLLYLQAAEVLHVWNTVIFFGILLFLSLFRLSVRRSQGVSEIH